MMFSSQLDVSPSPPQATQTPESKLKGASITMPVTVKQINDAVRGGSGGLVVDGVDVTNVRLIGLVSGKTQRATDVTFSLDDCTGRIDFIRWINDAFDTNETAVMQNGMYVAVVGSLKGFQEKKRATAFSIKPVVDHNEIAVHFLLCVRIHIQNTVSKGQDSQMFQSSPAVAALLSNGSKDHQTPPSNKTPVQIGSNNSGNAANGGETDIYKLVLSVFQDPSLDCEHGLHINEVASRLGLPTKKIEDAIHYHVDGGLIYSTIDDFHFKSAFVD